jgi:hypothetical protein
VAIVIPYVSQPSELKSFITSWANQNPCKVETGYSPFIDLVIYGSDASSDTLVSEVRSALVRDYISYCRSKVTRCLEYQGHVTVL